MRHMALELLYVLPNCETVQNFVCVCGDVTQMAWTLQDVVPKTTKTMTATTSYLRSAAHLLLSQTRYRRLVVTTRDLATRISWGRRRAGWRSTTTASAELKTVPAAKRRRTSTLVDISGGSRTTELLRDVDSVLTMRQ